MPTPTRKPTREQPSPSPVVALYTEIVDRSDPVHQANAPIKRGTLYASLQGGDTKIAAAHPNLYFLREQRIPNNEQLVLWVWTTDEEAQDTYNAEISHLGESVAHPAYARVYTIRRNAYEAFPTIPNATPLTGLLGVKIINGGTGYTAATATFGVDGTGAEVQFVISNGVILSGIVTKEGTGFTYKSLIYIHGNGAGATASCIIQPASAILVKQVKTELPADDPRAHEYVRVVRVYETLPGPLLPFTRYDDNLGPIQGTRQAVLATGAAASLTATGKTTYETRDGSAVVDWKLVEAWSNGTGSAGNPAYPILDTELYDDKRGAIQRRTQIVVRSAGPAYSEVASIVLAGSVVTRTTYEPFNEFLLQKIVDTWTVAGPELQTDELGSENLTPAKFRRQIARVTTEQNVAADYTFPSSLTGNQVQVQLRQTNVAEAVLTIVEEVIGSGAALAGKVKTSEHGGLILVTAEQIVTEGYTPPDNWLVLDESVDPLGNGKSVHAKRTASGTFPILYRDEYDNRANAMVRHTKQIVQNTNQQGGISGGIVTEFQPLDKWLTIQMTSKFAAVPSVISYQSSVAVPLPGVLTDLKLFYAGGMFLGSNGKFTPQFELEPYIEITEAKMPPYEATIQEYFTLNPSAIVATGTEIRPKSVRCSGILQLTATQTGELPEGTSWSGGGKLNLRPVTIPIPECLHGAFNTIPAQLWPGLPAPPTPSWLSLSINVATMPIAATTPSSLSGTIRYVYPPERYRFGYYYVKVATLTL